MIFKRCKLTWAGMLGAYPEGMVSLNAYEEDGLVHVQVNGKDIFCGTVGDS